MEPADDQAREIAELRDRLSRLSQASLRINESLDFDTVLQGVLDSACSLTGARYGVITLLDESGQIEDFVTSGLTPEEHRRLTELPEGMMFFEYLSRITEPLRLSDFHSYTRALGLPEFRPPMAVSPVLTFLAAPIRHLGECVGAFYVGEKDVEFTPEDEETLVMFASQAALVIANARRHRDEQRARADLETLIDTSPVGVLVFDAKTGGLTSVNREARRIVSGLHMPDGSAEELLDMLTFRRADGREISLEEFPLAQALSTGESVRAEEIVIEVPDGGSVTTLVNATPIRSQEGEVVSVVVTVQDMTPLEEMERLRAEFLGMVSHELRTPLTSIKGSAATLTEAASDLDPAEMLQFFRIIGEQADYMRDLIGDLLDVARIETGELSVAPAPAEVATLVDEARSRFQSGGGRNNLHIDLSPELPLVMADGRRIIQVLNNLLTNAARTSHEASAIRVSAVREGYHVAVSVTDEGRGIAAERLPHLFRKFSRIDGEDRRRDIAGSGLGLAICKGIVETHGGRIWAESDGPGRGARFTFTIPVAGDAAAGVRSLSARRERAERERTRILAVDDDPQTLRHVRAALTKAGYTPVVTGDPEEVSRLMAEEEPRLVLLDLMLPGSDGMELMKEIREVSDVPVIFLSVNGQEDIIARAFEKGADDYVVKPFSPTELVARIKAALRKREAPEWAEPSEPYVFGELTIDYAERRVTLAGRPVQLTAIEYGLLFELSANAGRVMTYDRLLQRVWGLRGSGDSRRVRTAAKQLRRKLGDDANNPTYILNEPRVGYRMPKGSRELEALVNIWGERFAEVDLFIGYCRELNVDTDKDELEHYEKIRAMLPVARVVYPDEYVIQRDQSQWNGVTDWDGADQWPALGRLVERGWSFPSDCEGLADEDLVHCFDREMKTGANPYLIRPELAEFRPWSEYRVAVPDGDGNEIKRPTAEHYYSYWQVHQLSTIQQYPDLYKNAWLVERIPQDDSVRQILPRAPKKELLVEFDGKRRSFDALSFWITVYGRERNRTFASVAPMDGVRRLDDVQANSYRKRLTDCAGMVNKRFNMTPKDLYSFLRKLITLMEDYEGKERYKLAEALKSDIFAWEDLLMLTTGDTRNDVAEELGKTNTYDKRTFLHLDLATKERYYALDLLNSVSKDCGRALRQLGDPLWSFAEADANDLLDYCEQEGLGLLVTALSGMVAIGDEEYRRNFRRVQKYTNLKNVLTCYEYLLKSVSHGPGLAKGDETLTRLVRNVMGQEKWHSLFHMREQQRLHMGTSTQQFLTNLSTLMGDSQLKGSVEGYWAQQFLITCLARNMTVHSYPSEDRYYGNLFRPMLNAVVSATFYTWQLTKAHGWI